MDLSSLKSLAGDMASQLAEKIKNDPELLKKFKENPVEALKSIDGVKIPDESLQAVAKAVQAQLSTGDLAGKLGKLF